jgi:hypothetical protein
VVESKAKTKAAKVDVRRSSNAWWCPIDGTSMPLSATECAACGFKP